MLLIRKQRSRLIGCVVLAVTLCMLHINTVVANPHHYYNLITVNDTVPANSGPLPYPIRDRRGDFVGGENNRTLDLKTPSNIKDSVVYDPKTLCMKKLVQNITVPPQLTALKNTGK
jgi:hypothetical protein